MNECVCFYGAVAGGKNEAGRGGTRQTRRTEGKQKGESAQRDPPPSSAVRVVVGVERRLDVGAGTAKARESLRVKDVMMPQESLHHRKNQTLNVRRPSYPAHRTPKTRLNSTQISSSKFTRNEDKSAEK